MEDENEIAAIAEAAVLGARIKVVGVGGGGGNALNTMILSGLTGVEAVLEIEMDQFDLRSSPSWRFSGQILDNCGAFASLTPSASLYAGAHIATIMALIADITASTIIHISHQREVKKVRNWCTIQDIDELAQYTRVWERW